MLPPEADPPTAEQSYGCRKDKLVSHAKPLTLSLTTFPTNIVIFVVNYVFSKEVNDKVYDVVIRTSLRQS